MARRGLKGAARDPIETRLPEGASAQPAGREAGDEAEPQSRQEEMHHERAHCI